MKADRRDPVRVAAPWRICWALIPNPARRWARWRGVLVRVSGNLREFSLDKIQALGKIRAWR